MMMACGDDRRSTMLLDTSSAFSTSSAAPAPSPPVTPTMPATMFDDTKTPGFDSIHVPTTKCTTMAHGINAAADRAMLASYVGGRR